VKAIFSILAAAAVYEVVARGGWFAAALVPTLPAVARTLWAMLADGTMAGHALSTLYRVFAGLALAAALGLVLGFLMPLASLLTWAERRQSAMMQDRLGPNRANIGRFRAWGLLHFLADAVKMIFKEDFVPIVRSGPAGMPAFTDSILSDSDLDSIYAFLKAAGRGGSTP